MTKEPAQDQRAIASWTTDSTGMRAYPGPRHLYLSWLATELGARGLPAKLVMPNANGSVILRITRARDRQVRFVACVPAPSSGWAFVWSNGWALVREPWAVTAIAEEMAS